MSDFLNGTELILHLKANYHQMSGVEKKISDFFMQSLEQVPDKTVTEISGLCNVSEASIIRFVRKLGFTGFYQMKIELAKTAVSSISEQQNDNEPEGTASILEKAGRIAIDNIQHSYENLSIPDLEKAVDLFSSCHSIYFFAAGNSLPLCHDFIYRLGRLGIRGVACDIPEMALLYAENMEQGDIAFALTHSGDSTLVNNALQKVKKNNLPVICLTNYRKSPVVKWADLVLVTSIRDGMFKGGENLTRLTETSILDLLFYLLFYRKKQFNEQLISWTESEQSLYSL